MLRAYSSSRVSGTVSAIVSLLSDSELAIRAVSARAQDLVLIRHHLEASEGLGILIARRGGHALLVAPKSLSHELDRFIEEMRSEFELETQWTDEHQEALGVAL